MEVSIPGKTIKLNRVFQQTMCDFQLVDNYSVMFEEICQRQIKILQPTLD